MTAQSSRHTAAVTVRRLALGVLLAVAAALLGVLVAAPSQAAVVRTAAHPVAATAALDAAAAPLAAPLGAATGPTSPTAPTDPTDPSPGDVTVNIPGQPSQVVSIIILTTLLGVAPAILLLCTSFPKIVVVLSFTRTALGTPTVPPNQVLIGLALFLSLFVMGPTIDAVRAEGVQPYMDGTKTLSQAYQDGQQPLRKFMLAHTRDEELALMVKAAGAQPPKDRNSVELRTLVPAFVVSELRSAFIIGFVIFVPFLVIDIVVSAILMSLGMVMLPPSLVSLPFKLLLFVLVDGWSLVVSTIVGGYR